MNYNELKFQDKYIGKKLISGARTFIVSNDLSANDKKYIYNLITKQVFDIFNTPSIEVKMSEPVTQKEVQVIEVKNIQNDESNLDDKSLKELRIMFPNITARSKKEFIKELKESKN